MGTRSMISEEHGPPGSRLFCICGNAVEVDNLREAFDPFGALEYVKKVKEKGVAFVKYDKASSAALAIEHLHGTALNAGRGPTIKVVVAEPPPTTGVSSIPSTQMLRSEGSYDPDNTPPRSRLFIVVPKQADPIQIQKDLVEFKDVSYCKTDLISVKGIVFLKFSKASSALAAMEEINLLGMVCGYKVKCMLADPRKRRSDMSPDAASPVQPGRFDGFPSSSGSFLQQLLSNPTFLAQYMAHNAAGSPLNNFISTPGNFHKSRMLGMSGNDSMPSSPYLGSSCSPDPTSCLNHSSSNNNNNINNLSSPDGLRKQRLFIVVNKAVTDDQLARLFKRYPGMEYCDLKKDRATGKSKGYCFVNYSTPEVAETALVDLNGTEFPAHSGHRIKVGYAEPMGPNKSPGSPALNHMSSPLTSMPLGALTPQGLAGGMIPMDALTNHFAQVPFSTMQHQGSLGQGNVPRVRSFADFHSHSSALIQHPSAARQLFDSNPQRL